MRSFLPYCCVTVIIDHEVGFAGFGRIIEMPTSCPLAGSVLPVGGSLIRSERSSWCEAADRFIRIGRKNACRTGARLVGRRRERIRYAVGPERGLGPSCPPLSED